MSQDNSCALGRGIRGTRRRASNHGQNNSKTSLNEKLLGKIKSQAKLGRGGFAGGASRKRYLIVNHPHPTVIISSNVINGSPSPVNLPHPRGTAFPVVALIVPEDQIIPVEIMHNPIHASISFDLLHLHAPDLRLRELRVL